MLHDNYFQNLKSLILAVNCEHISEGKECYKNVNDRNILKKIVCKGIKYTDEIILWLFTFLLLQVPYLNFTMENKMIFKTTGTPHKDNHNETSISHDYLVKRTYMQTNKNKKRRDYSFGKREVIKRTITSILVC